MLIGPKVLAFTFLSAGCLLSATVTVRFENSDGSVKAQVANSNTVKFRYSSPRRRLRPEDTSITETPEKILLVCRPADGAWIDVEVDLPYGTDFSAITKTGAIAVTGLIHRADLTTDTGHIKLAVPWAATRLQIESKERPSEFSTPKGVKFSERQISDRDRRTWLLSDRLPEQRVTYGEVQVHARVPGRLDLIDIPLPDDSPVKLHWQAAEILEELLAGPKRGKSAPTVVAERHVESKPVASDTGLPVFTADVRIVNLSVAVFDRKGTPVSGLKPEDFEVLEDGVPQKVAVAGSEEVPFNLILLLDLSGSTKYVRAAMKEAARRFIEIARPQDRVAVYALANDMFHVVARLTKDRTRLRSLIDALPDVSGGTPLYDAIILSYAEELRQRHGERNAIIVLSDGVDNRIYGLLTPSEVKFDKLLKAAEVMDALIYPVFLDPFYKVPPPEWVIHARRNLEKLANTSGGRLFPAHSIHELDPVYPQVAEELRSVYSIAYYPQNQNFDRAWRKVQVKVKRPGVTVRTRAGYYAR